MMRTRTLTVVASVLAVFALLQAGATAAAALQVRARSAMLVDLTDDRILYEQNADTPIAPASLTKVLTLYLVHEAIEQGRISPWENVRVSARAAATGGSRMGLHTGDLVPVAELIKGMAVVSGNDACVAIAEHLSGSVEQFVQLMNRKAAELGMHHSTFMTPNGLPAKGQFTTARDIAKLSAAYLKRFPTTLDIHSMKSYTYGRSTHRNANRLLGTCPGVDGLKTGFVCSSGYNITATAYREAHRLVAVVLGANSPGTRAAETAKLLNQGYASLGIGTPLIYAATDAGLNRAAPSRKGSKARQTAAKKSKGQSTRLAESGSSAKTSAHVAANPGVGGKSAAIKVAKAQNAPTAAAKSSAQSGSGSSSGKKAQAAKTATGVSSAKSAQKTTRTTSSTPAKAGQPVSAAGKTKTAKDRTQTAKPATPPAKNKTATSKNADPGKTVSSKKDLTAAKTEKTGTTDKQKSSSPASRKTASTPKAS